jgi:hypothetical protein
VTVTQQEERYFSKKSGKPKGEFFQKVTTEKWFQLSVSLAVRCNQCNGRKSVNRLHVVVYY